MATAASEPQPPAVKPRRRAKRPVPHPPVSGVVEGEEQHTLIVTPASAVSTVAVKKSAPRKRSVAAAALPSPPVPKRSAVAAVAKRRPTAAESESVFVFMTAQVDPGSQVVRTHIKTSPRLKLCEHVDLETDFDPEAYEPADGAPDGGDLRGETFCVAIGGYTPDHANLIKSTWQLRSSKTLIGYVAMGRVLGQITQRRPYTNYPAVYALNQHGRADTEPPSPK